MYCFAFANHHKYLATRAIRRGDDVRNEDDGNDNAMSQQSVDATADADDGKESTADSSLNVDVNLNAREASWRKSDKEGS